MAADRADDQEPARVLGRALRDLQRRSGHTLRDLETSVSISDSSLSRYFLGITVPPWATVRDLCEALGGDPSEYRHLWQAADRSQRKPARRQRGKSGEPAQGEPGRDARAAGAPVRSEPGQDAPAESAPVKSAPVPDGTAAGGTATGGTATGGTAAGEASVGTPGRRGGRTVWALAGAVIGLVLGAVSTVLVQPQAPASSGGDAPTASAGAHGVQGASAASSGPRIFVSRATGACLDDSLDQGTRSFPCNGMPYQRWTVRTTPDGSSQLRNHATGECLDHLPGGLSTGPCGSSASQRWTVSARDDVAVEIRSTTARRCLADSAGGLRVSPCDGTTRQKWA
ncbi:helix-turn-helix domain-containing protein [Streptomyces gardneri]|uniref:helix-turn-helix domain-containing protein n=1 Tax=Streptomyces gardneri TaxID=66892 RepID=UPI0036CFE8D3